MTDFLRVRIADDSHGSFWGIKGFIAEDMTEQPSSSAGTSTAMSTPDFWSSLSVVESLFSDDVSPYESFQQKLSKGITELENEEDILSAEPWLVRLPTNILFRICGYVSARDLARLEQVCKMFVPIVTENSLWKELYLKRWKLLEFEGQLALTIRPIPREPKADEDEDGEEAAQDEWAWIYSLLQQNERWKDIYKTRHAAEQWRIGTLKMFNGCWGFISQAPEDANLGEGVGIDGQQQALDIFFHRKDISPDGPFYEDWWLQDTPGVSRSQKCGYWDTFLYGRKVRYKQRAAYAQGRRPQACKISFLENERPLRELNDTYGSMMRGGSASPRMGQSPEIMPQNTSNGGYTSNGYASNGTNSNVRHQTKVYAEKRSPGVIGSPKIGSPPASPTNGHHHSAVVYSQGSAPFAVIRRR